MAATDLYFLPTDVRLIPVAELGEEAKEKFEYNENDFVVTHLHSRNTSRVIDEGAASLLKEFRDPKSLVEGVMSYSVSNRLDPQEVLDECYYFLAQLRREGFLIPFTDGETGNYQEILQPGHPFREFTIVEKIQGLSDTRVFRITGRDGRSYALKILSTGGKEDQLATNFRNELAILKHLDGKVNPLLIEEGEYNGHSYMVMEWCEGVPCMREAAKYHSFSDPKNIQTLLDLAGNVLEAYAHLHAQGVIHADIHPGNVLISPAGEIKIIDFGLARRNDPSVHIVRGGMAFFYEAEYALALLSGKKPPQASFTGEQYALGALLYQLITGRQYLVFSFEKQELFRQIAWEMPDPFSKYDLDLDPEIEVVLSKALSKSAEQRYPSVAVFAEKWSRLKGTRGKEEWGKGIDREACGDGIDLDPCADGCMKDDFAQGFSGFTKELIRKFGWKGKFIDGGLQLAPTGSVNYGAAGIAYFFFRCAQVEEDAGLLALADLWANRASAAAGVGDSAFYSKELDIIPKTVGRSSIYHTVAGVHLVQSMISNAMGDYYSLTNSLTGFLSEAIQPCDNPDLTLGRSGMLTGCALLWENIPLLDGSSFRDELKTTGDRLLGELWSLLDTYPSLAADSTIYYGIAHGWAGFLYATARWCLASGSPEPAGFYPRVDQLLGLALTEGRQMRWPLTGTQKDSWPGWCHGSAGYVFLWTSLFALTGDRQFIRVAEGAAHHFLSGETMTNGSLCCGTAGEAYSLLNLYRATSDTSWLVKARQIAARTLRNSHSAALRANSLYKGDVGLGVLFAEIGQPEYARMPVFE
jgi:aminoglycoside phosphotransferase (APT) family kinase protein